MQLLTKSLFVLLVHGSIKNLCTNIASFVGKRTKTPIVGGKKEKLQRSLTRTAQSQKPNITRAAARWVTRSDGGLAGVPLVYISLRVMHLRPRGVGPLGCRCGQLGVWMITEKRRQPAFFPQFRNACHRWHGMTAYAALLNFDPEPFPSCKAGG
jgi:hypothetical protein